MTVEPPRLRDPSSGASDSLRELLRSSSSDGPSPAQLQQLAARLEPQLASPPPSASPAAATIGATKVIVTTLVVAVVVATVGYWVGRPDAPRQAAPLAVTRLPVASPAVASPPSLPVARSQPAQSAPIAAPPVASPSRPIVPDQPPRSAPVVRSGTPASPSPRTGKHPARVEPPRAVASIEAPAAPPSASGVAATEDELVILGHAQRALVAQDARTALAHAERHAAQFPFGMMVEEREAIAIEALARLGRREDARARFERFRASHARSSYRHRLERLNVTDP
jgi:hypothetical protein